MAFLLPKNALHECLFVFFSPLLELASKHLESFYQIFRWTSRLLRHYSFHIVGSQQSLLKTSVEQLYNQLNYNWQQKCTQTHSSNCWLYIFKGVIEPKILHVDTVVLIIVINCPNSVLELYTFSHIHHGLKRQTRLRQKHNNQLL